MAFRVGNTALDETSQKGIIMQPIDNTALLNDAHRIIGSADDFVKKLHRDIIVDSPEKAKTIEMIEMIINIQSEAIRRLVDQHVQICDRLNQAIETHSL